jgi:hypothetical protein
VHKFRSRRVDAEDHAPAFDVAAEPPEFREKYDQSIASEGHKLGVVVARPWYGLLVSKRRPAGGYLSAYVQQRFQISMALSGAATVEGRFNGLLDRGGVKSGTIWTMPPGYSVGYSQFGEGEFEALHLYPDLDKLFHQDMDAGIAEHLPALLGFDDPLIEQIGRAIAAEMETETSAGTLLVEHLSRLLAARLVHTHGSALSAEAVTQTRHGLDDRRLSRAYEYMAENLDRALTMEDIVAVVHLSPFHFARTFRHATGLTLQQHVSNQRLRLARFC